MRYSHEKDNHEGQQPWQGQKHRSLYSIKRLGVENRIKALEHRGLLTFASNEDQGLRQSLPAGSVRFVLYAAVSMPLHGA
jgi:hypothetical protein